MTGSVGGTPEIKNIATIEGVEIGFVADPAHSQKNGKSLFMKYDVQIPDKYVAKYDLTSNTAKYQYIKDLIEFNEKRSEKKIPVPKDLNRKMCLNYSKFAQMDVKPAMAVFNFATADAIDYMVANEGWPDEARTTAVYIRLWARWYQIMGAYSREHGFDSEKPREMQEKLDFLYDFMDFYGGCKYLGNRNHLNLWGNQKHVLCSTSTVIWLVLRLLKDKNVGFFLPGYLLGNSVENLHTDVRRINPTPTPIIYMRILRGIAMTQMMGESVKGSSYELDQGNKWLVNLTDHKKLQAPDPEEAADIDFFEDVESAARELHDEMVVSFIGGGVLKKVLIGDDPLVPKSKCTKCIEFWTATTETSNHVLNALIRQKEYRPDAMVTPSDVGHLIFQYADELFVQNRGKFVDQKGLIDAFVTFLIERISERFEGIPDCHFRAIFKKSITGKWHHYSKFLNSEFIQVNRDEIDQEANASRSTKARSLINPVTGPVNDWQDPNHWETWLDPEIPELFEDQDHIRNEIGGIVAAEMGDGQNGLELDIDMAEVPGNDDLARGNVLNVGNNQDHLDLEFEMADGQGNVDTVNKKFKFKNLIGGQENVDGMADGQGNVDGVADGQGNVDTVNKRFKFKKLIGGQENVDPLNENISEMVRSPDHPDLDSDMADSYGIDDTFNVTELADSQQNVECVGNSLVMDGGHGSVDEVRDNVSEWNDAPEIVEASPQPVFAHDRAQSFATVADFCDLIGDDDHELSD